MANLPDIEALLTECRFEATRSSGSGGQNVNKVSTKVILLFNVLDSNVLDQEQKEIFLSKLYTRISKNSIFRISSGRERTQLANRKLVIEKFFKLVEKAFETEEERIATKPTKGSKLRRIESKKALSGKKADRTQRWNDNEDN
ncbi:MAG: alternative ribosome rescue aminoacyl-tRNA hydrolase ArfB [Bacteroidales bacterium]|nr:alternative ribosome rescue aminoacyl-tRNA hydrolase ArfB [Bacteroidales bacterium]